MSAGRVASEPIAVQEERTEATEWRTSRRAIDLTRPALMGVLNVTPDSFSDGGRYLDRRAAQRRLVELHEQGADIIDFGGESTRPGSSAVDEEEELRRVIPVIEFARENTDVPISIDTTKPAVARAAIEAGAEIINDISGLRFDSKIASLAAEFGAGLVLMHLRGVPRTMQERIHYDDLIDEISGELLTSIEEALAAGCDPNQLVIDPGIGFGKTAEQNLILIQELDRFRRLGYPILIGPSRKSFMGEILGLALEDRLEATIAACVVSLLRGARIFRVHDVRAVRRALDMAFAIVRQSDRAEYS